MKKILTVIICICSFACFTGCRSKTNNNQNVSKHSVGDIITFGSYEQDNDVSNSTEPIEWRVLDIRDGKMLVISRLGLDAKPYNETLADVTWETCTLRAWLNDEFYNSAFTDEEKAKISTVTVTADANPYSNIDPGNDTQDNIFLLSTVEAEKYFESDSDRICVPTDYSIANGVQIKDGIYNCWWWLRSPGKYQNFAWRVHYYGDLEGTAGHSVDTDFFAVRPAMWIELN